MTNDKHGLSFKDRQARRQPLEHLDARVGLRAVHAWPYAVVYGKSITGENLR